MSDRYDNLISVSSGLQTQGGVLKIIGMITAGSGCMGGFFMRESFGMALVAVVAGIVFGVGFYVAGTFVAAAGEALLALSDIAVNTKVR